MSSWCHLTFIFCFVPGTVQSRMTGDRGEAGTHYLSQWSGRRFDVYGDCIARQNLDELFWEADPPPKDGVFLSLLLLWFPAFEVGSISQRRKQSHRKI